MIKYWTKIFFYYASIPAFLISTAALLYVVFKQLGITIALFYSLISIGSFLLLGLFTAQLVEAINRFLAIYRSILRAPLSAAFLKLDLFIPNSIRRAEVAKLEHIDRTTFFAGETAPKTSPYLVLEEAGKRFRYLIKIPRGHRFPTPKRSGCYYKLGPSGIAITTHIANLFIGLSRQSQR